MLEIIFVIIAILILDGVVSAAEAAFFSISINHARLLAEKGWNAKILLKLKEKSESPIVTLISLSNIITIAGSVLVGAMVSWKFGTGWLGAVSVVLTFLIMVFAEILPKKLGERFSEPVSLTSAPFLLVISFLFSPIIWFVSRIARPFTGNPPKFTTSEEEISFLAKRGGHEGAIEEGESRMIEKIFKLNDITAKEIMTPRPMVKFLDGNQALVDIKEEIFFQSHSRLPVFDGTRDNIIGIVRLQELLSALAKGEENRLVREYVRPAFFVPESRLADDLLRDFQQKRTHLAVVIDEHGGVIGVAGLEDIMEELVGEIIDEKEVAPETIKRVSKNEIVVHGQTQTETLNHFFNTAFKSKKTVNGFLLGKFGRFPKEGEEITIDGIRFVVDKTGEHEIGKIRVYKPES